MGSAICELCGRGPGRMNSEHSFADEKLMYVCGVWVCYRCEERLWGEPEMERFEEFKEEYVCKDV